MDFYNNSQEKPCNLIVFKERLLALFRFYIKEKKGVLPFVYGVDYKPEMS